MHRPLKNILAYLTVPWLLAVASCHKSNAPVFGGYSMQSVFINMAITPDTFTMNANVGGTFATSSGAIVYFPPFSLERDSLGISGNVNVQFAAYLKYSDMIFSGVLPYSNGEAFNTGGMFYINVTQYGLPVVLAKPLQYSVTLPESLKPAEGMLVYYGRPDDTVASNLVNWQPVSDTTQAKVQYRADSITLFTDSVHFCAAGMPIGAPAYQSFGLSVSAPISAFSDTILAYAIYDSVRTVWQMGSAYNHVITETHVAGWPLHFVAFTVIDGYFYGGILAATPVTGRTYNLSLSKTSPAALRQQIDVLK